MPSINRQKQSQCVALNDSHARLSAALKYQNKSAGPHLGGWQNQSFSLLRSTAMGKHLSTIYTTTFHWNYCALVLHVPHMNASTKCFLIADEGKQRWPGAHVRKYKRCNNKNDAPKRRCCASSSCYDVQLLSCDRYQPTKCMCCVQHHLAQHIILQTASTWRGSQWIH